MIVAYRQQCGDSQRERVWGLDGIGQRWVKWGKKETLLGSWVQDAVCR